MKNFKNILDISKFMKKIELQLKALIFSIIPYYLLVILRYFPKELFLNLIVNI